MRSDIVVSLSDGVYALDRALAFGPQDSGTNGYRVVYGAAPGAHPVLSGGRVIAGWQRVTGTSNTWAAPVPSGFDTRQLYVNGQSVPQSQRSAAGRLHPDLDRVRHHLHRSRHWKTRRTWRSSSRVATAPGPSRPARCPRSCWPSSPWPNRAGATSTSPARAAKRSPGSTGPRAGSAASPRSPSRRSSRTPTSCSPPGTGRSTPPPTRSSTWPPRARTWPTPRWWPPSVRPCSTCRAPWPPQCTTSPSQGCSSPTPPGPPPTRCNGFAEMQADWTLTGPARPTPKGRAPYSTPAGKLPVCVVDPDSGRRRALRHPPRHHRGRHLRPLSAAPVST